MSDKKYITGTDDDGNEFICGPMSICDAKAECEYNEEVEIVDHDALSQEEVDSVIPFYPEKCGD